MARNSALRDKACAICSVDGRLSPKGVLHPVLVDSESLSCLGGPYLSLRRDLMVLTTLESTWSISITTVLYPYFPQLTGLLKAAIRL